MKNRPGIPIPPYLVAAGGATLATAFAGILFLIARAFAG